SNPRKRHRED
nr:Chain B, DNA mismatch repair protein Mlh1 [Homo sapiens]5U5P_C Chain C, DNA mismatch repair protein Mlh1 [Homo sapiens]